MPENRLQWIVTSLTVGSLLAILAAGWAVERVLEDSTKSLSRTLLESQVRGARLAMHERLAVELVELQSIAASRVVQDAARQLLDVPRESPSLLASPAQDALREELFPVLRRPPRYGYFLIADDDVSIASSRDVNVGTENPLARIPGFLEEVRSGRTLASPPIWSEVALPDAEGTLRPRPTMFLATPLMDEDRVVAVLTSRLDPTEIFGALADLAPRGGDKAIYAFNDSGTVVAASDALSSSSDPLSELSFPLAETTHQSEAPLRSETPWTAASVTSSLGSNVDGYRGVRGTDVVGAWIWDDDFGFGLTTEVPRDQGLAPMLRARRAIRGATFLISLPPLLLLLMLARENRRMGDRNVELHRTVGELDEEKTALEAFSSVVAHDLKAPLRTVSQFGRILEKEADFAEDSSEKQLLGRIHAATDRMTRLVDDLLEFSRLRSAPLERQSVPLGEVAAEVVQDLETRILESEAIVEVGDLPTVQGDRGRLRQLLQNLVGNALTYCPEDRTPRIHVSASSDSERGGHWIHVRDNGLGVEPEFRERIFKAFERLHRQEDFAGTGLGLAICQSVVEQHGGEIVLDSKLGEGSTFSVWIPEGDSD